MPILPSQSVFGMFPNRKFTVNNEVEVLAQKSTTKRIKLAAGISLLRNPFVFENVQFRSKLDLQSTIIPADQLGRVRDTDYVLGLPVYVHYYGRRKKNILIGLGLQHNLLFFSRTVIHPNKPNQPIGKEIHNQRTYYSYYSALLDIGYNHQLPNKDELIIALHTSTNLSMLFDKLAGDFYDYTIGLSIGYNFKANK